VQISHICYQGASPPRHTLPSLFVVTLAFFLYLTLWVFTYLWRLRGQKP